MPDAMSDDKPMHRHAVTAIMGLFQRAYEYAVFYAGLLLFGAMCLLWSPLAAGLYPFLPREAGRALGRFAIMMVFRTFLGFLRLSGLFRFDLSELDTLREERGLIVAPNHPTLWDAVMIVSRLPEAACIMKAAILNNIFLGGGARMARYIRNESLRQMLKLAIDELRRGGCLLLFPEGTRTVHAPVNPFKGSIGVIASRAGAPVQTVFIETQSPFLTKGWPVYKMPRLPLTYRVRLGKRFEAPADSDAFMDELARYFAAEMAPAPRTGETALADAALPGAQGKR
jgi:1-acyl-sn-glycerol-3-phosphate acyltransferase